MQQLLRITSTPAQYELVSQPARLEIVQERPKHVMTRQPGQVQIRQQHVKMQMDSFEMRSSMGLKSPFRSADEAAQRGVREGIQAIADKVDFGNQILHIEKGANIPDAIFSQMMQRSGGELVFVPLNPSQISFISGRADLTYLPAKLDFDWNVPQTKFQFQPGSLTINIKQYASLQIEYLGEPNYVPPSAAPGYAGTA